MHIVAAPSPSPSANPGKEFFDKIGLHAPHWLIIVGTIVLAAGAVIGALKPLVSLARSGAGTAHSANSRRRERARAVNRRRLFADHLESQLRRISEKEDWRDDRFAELVAKVEIEGAQRRSGRLLRARSADDGTRLVKSLSVGLQRSTERLILLQGEPGAGKSVALRHLAYRMLRHAMRSHRLTSTLPLYLNLKEFRPPVRPVTGGHIRDFVFAACNRSNNRDVDEFMTNEFDKGLAEGTWLFLFDSFDEIPDILSATEADEVIEEYADAVYDFLHVMNSSRGVVASREFKGPRKFGWPRFTVLRLARAQRTDLIRRAHLTAEQEGLLLGSLPGADPSLAEFAGNPMLLGLLCAYVHHHDEFPEASHRVFEDFVEARLAQDDERVFRRFGVRTPDLRRAAEQAAFCMAAVPGLGLSPARDDLSAAVEDQFGPRPGLATLLNGLEFVKLANAPESGGSTGAHFTFAHRRFQEFFATCVVLREPGRVPTDRLVLDGQWRETAVTMLQAQAQDSERVGQIVTYSGAALHAPAAGESEFRWPRNSLHVLSLLSAGIADPGRTLPDPMREQIGELLGTAYREGRRLDRKWALEAATLAPDPVRDDLLEMAAESSSGLLQEAAFIQAGRLRELPPRVGRHVRRVLIGQAATGELRHDRVAVNARLRHLDRPEPYLDAVRLLLAAPVVDAGIILLALLAVTVGGHVRSAPIYSLIVLAAGALAFSFRALRSHPVISTATHSAAAKTTLFTSVGRGMASMPGFTFLCFVRAVGSLLLIGGLALSEPTKQNVRGAVIFVILNLVALYVGSWSIIALVRVSSGRPVPIAVWPAIPLAEAVHLAKFVLRERVAQRLSVFGGLLAITAAIVFAAQSIKLPAALVNWASVAMLGLFSVVMIGSIIGKLVEIRRGRRDVAAIRALPGNLVLTQTATLDVLGSIQTEAGLQEFVRLIRRDDLQIGPDGVAVLLSMSDLFERSEDDEPGEPGDFPGSGEDGHVRCLLGVDLAFRHVTERTLDDIARLADERLAISQR